MLSFSTESDPLTFEDVQLNDDDVNPPFTWELPQTTPEILSTLNPFKRCHCPY